VGDSLPPATDRYREFLAGAEVEWSDHASVIEYLADYQRMLAGGERPFDEAASRELPRRDIERARNIASAENHGHAAEGDCPLRRSHRQRRPRL
jgi:hypothetical protein